jgi:hypothetical protein
MELGTVGWSSRQNAVGFDLVRERIVLGELGFVEY